MLREPEIGDSGTSSMTAESARWWEIEARRVHEWAGGGDLSAALEHGEALLASSTASPMARIQTLHTLGLLAARRGTSADLNVAARHLSEAAEQALVAGDTRWRAQALVSIATYVHHVRGAFDDAAAAFAEALALAGPHPRTHAFFCILAAHNDIGRGRPEAAMQLLNQAFAFGRSESSADIISYVAWMEARLSASREDHAGALMWLAQVEQHHESWIGGPLGLRFLVDAAQICGQVGAREQACSYLDAAKHRVDGRTEGGGGPGRVMFAAALHEARFGDPDAAEAALARHLDHPRLPTGEVWRLNLMRAFARLRAGDAPGARDLAAAAVSAAEAIADRGLIHRLEPSVARELAEVLPTNDDGIGWRIRLLGGFEIMRGEDVLSLPNGRTAELVKLLSLQRSGRLSVDAAAESLWPDSPPGVSRRRLRNVLSRLRAAVGDLIMRSGDELAFAAGVTIDVTEFVRLSTAAQERTSGSDRAAAVAAALALYHGDLLPGDEYAPWAATPRDRLRSRALTLLDGAATHAEQRGDVEAALDALTRMHHLEPLDEHAPLRAAHLLTAAGQVGRAQAWRARAEQICAELGISMPADM